LRFDSVFKALETQLLPISGTTPAARFRPPTVPFGKSVNLSISTWSTFSTWIETDAWYGLPYT